MATHNIHKSAPADATRNILITLRSATTGAPVSPIAHGAVTIKYVLNNSANTTTTVTVVEGTLGTYTSGGWKATGDGATHQFGLPAALLTASGAASARISVSAAGCITAVEQVNILGSENGLTGKPELPLIDANRYVTVLEIFGKSNAIINDGLALLKVWYDSFADPDTYHELLPKVQVYSQNTYTGAALARTADLPANFGLLAVNASGYVTATNSSISIGDVQTALTNQGYTATLATNLGTTNGRISGNVALAADLTTVGNNVTAVKAKTDTIPAWPTNFSLLAVNASGYVTATNSSISIGDVQTALTNQGYTTTLAANLGTTNGRIGGNVALAADLTTVGNNVTAIKGKTDTIPTWPANFSLLAVNASGYVTATNSSLSIGDVQTALTNQGYTTSLATAIGTTNGRISGNVALAADLTTIGNNVTAVKGKTDTIPTWPTNFSLLAVNGSGHVTATNNSISIGDVQTALTNQGYTTTLATNLGTTNGRIGGNVALAADLTTVGNNVTAIKGKTDTIPTWPTNFSALAISEAGAVQGSFGQASLDGVAETVWAYLVENVDTPNSIGLALAQRLSAFPANFALLSIDAGGYVTATNGGGGSGLTIADVQTALTNQGYTTSLATAIGTTNGRIGGNVALAADLTTVGNNVTAVKAKTDTIPAWPTRFSDLVIDVSGRVTASNTFITGADVQSAMTAQGYTTALAANIGTTNGRIGGNVALAADLTTVGNNVTAVKAKTDTIPAWPTNFSLLSVNASGHVTATNNSITINDVQTALTNQGYTTALAAAIGTTNGRIGGNVALAADLTTVGNNVTAVKAKTDTIPAWPINFSQLAIDGSGQVTIAGGGITISDVQTAMTNQGFTAAVAGRIDVPLSSLADALAAVKGKTDAIPAWPTNFSALEISESGAVSGSFGEIAGIEMAREFWRLPQSTEFPADSMAAWLLTNVVRPGAQISVVEVDTPAGAPVGYIGLR